METNILIYLSLLGEWEKAYQFATAHLEGDIIKELFKQKAKEEESMAMYKDAEILYTLIGEVGLAISMYKTLRQYDQVQFSCI